MAKKKETNFLQELYEDMSLEELKDDVIKNLKRIKIVEAKKKDFVDSAKETIKECKERLDAVLYWIGVKETEKEKAVLEGMTLTALKGETNVRTEK